MDETATTSGGTTAGPSSSTVTEDKTQVTNTKRIVILGKTGAGKSSLVNTIFGEKLFKIDHTFSAGTKECRAETRSVNGRNITLIDTPGFFDTNRPEEELKRAIVRSIVECAPGPHAFLIVLKVEKFTKHEESVISKISDGDQNGRNITLIDTPGFFDTNRPEEELKRAIVRSIVECAPGPHAFLIVLKVEKFTKHEESVISKIKNSFSDDVFKYATVVFTHGDQLDEEQTIEDLVCQNQLVSDLVEKCGGRCHVIDNKYWNGKPEDEYRCNQFHVEELLKTIDNITEAHQGGCYTNENLKAVEREKQQEEEHIRQSSGNISEGEIREQAKGSVFKKLLKKLAHIATGALLGAFYGVLGSTILTQGTSFQAAGTGLGTFAAGGVGAMFGGIAAYDATDEEDTLQGGTERATQTVTDGALFLLDKVQEVVDKVSKIKKSQK
ncbi:GTPase IMAP family member 7-like [Epinephelus fuscoguttatus]|uniref:GTPase IMAP family member 7-like n=1 Tax=Epinephelus fuscoguttatus TaxID=293821 RepID=UPI0020D0033E|nr:GTPase IMAP family member 7-like [Epinephelus fuscoguttatus]